MNGKSHGPEYGILNGNQQDVGIMVWGWRCPGSGGISVKGLKFRVRAFGGFGG